MMPAVNKIDGHDATTLSDRLDHSCTGYGFIESCLSNTRILHKETDDASVLLFYAMTALGRFTKGSTAIQDFVSLFTELGHDQCASIVETSSYRPEDLGFYWSTSQDVSSLFQPSTIKAINNYKTSEQDRSLGDTIMRAAWGDYPFYEVDKIPSTIKPRHWGLYNLQDATIIYDNGEFAVLDHSGRPVIALCSKNYQHVYFTKLFRKHYDRQSDTPTAEPTSAVLDNALMIQDLIRQPNFCHWLLDHIPRLRHLEESHEIIMYTLAPFMKNMLELMGIDPARVHEMKERAVVCVGNLTIESSMATNFYHPCQDMNADLVNFVRTSLSSKQNIESQSEKLNESDKTQSSHRHIYLSRNKFDRRRIVNEDQLLRSLEKYDFQIIYPEQLSMPEQIELFKNAEVIVSPHGASLANLVFCQKTTLIEIFNQNYGTPTFYLMAKLFGFPYQHILGKNPLLSKADQERIGLSQLQYEDMEVDIEKLDECLEVVFSDYAARHKDQIVSRPMSFLSRIFAVLVRR